MIPLGVATADRRPRSHLVPSPLWLHLQTAPPSLSLWSARLWSCPSENLSIFVIFGRLSSVHTSQQVSPSPSLWSWQRLRTDVIFDDLFCWIHSSAARLLYFLSTQSLHKHFRASLLSVCLCVFLWSWNISAVLQSQDWKCVQTNSSGLLKLWAELLIFGLSASCETFLRVLERNKYVESSGVFSLTPCQQWTVCSMRPHKITRCFQPVSPKTFVFLFFYFS